MGHVTRLEVGVRDVEYNSIDKEATRLVEQVTALIARMLKLWKDDDSTAEDKNDIEARQAKLIADMTVAVEVAQP